MGDSCERDIVDLRARVATLEAANEQFALIIAEVLNLIAIPKGTA